MKKIDGERLTPAFTPQELLRAEGSEISLPARVHKLRRSSGFTFVMLRAGGNIIQAVHTAGCKGDLTSLCEGAYVNVTGTVKKEPRAALGYEITLNSFAILSRPTAESPLDISAARAGWSVETSAGNRASAMRHIEESAVIRVCAGVSTAFRSFMCKNGFTEIHTPKITSSKCEDKSHAFKLKFFGKNAYLAQSPQLFKQICTAFFDRVFETSPSYRADMHNSARHLSEFISLDFEMAFVSDIYEIMDMETAALKYITGFLNEHFSYELDIIGAKLPSVSQIPSVTFHEALDILQKKRSQYDLDPTDEVKLCRWARENYGSEFVFVEKFPSKKRPFYVKCCDVDSNLTESFDLLLSGMEIATGSLRVNSYDELTAGLDRAGIGMKDLGGTYIDAFKYGLPPHGGLSMGLERLVMQLLQLENIRQASLFPTDLHHLYP